MAIYKACRAEQGEIRKSILCEKNRNDFYKFLGADDYYLCRQILEENKDCSDWYKNASKALYHATKRPDFPSAATSRPTYNKKSQTSVNPYQPGSTHC